MNPIQAQHLQNSFKYMYFALFCLYAVITFFKYNAVHVVITNLTV